MIMTGRGTGGLIGVNTGENDHDRTRNRWLIGEVSPGEEQKDPGKCGADDGTKQVRTTDCDTRVLVHFYSK